MEFELLFKPVISGMLLLWARLKNFNQPAFSFITDPVIKIVGVLPSLQFIKYVIQSHVFQTGIVAYGRPEFYLVMSPVLYFVSIV